MLTKLGCVIEWTSCSLKTWRFELIMVSCAADIWTVSGLSIEGFRVSTECTDHLFCLASSQGDELSSYRLMADFWLQTGTSFFPSVCSSTIFNVLLQIISKNSVSDKHYFFFCFILLWSHLSFLFFFFLHKRFPLILTESHCLILFVWVKVATNAGLQKFI